MDPNLTGNRGEMIASCRLMEGQLFYVECIGGKTPTFDLLCTIVPEKGTKEKPYQFLVQVKSSISSNLYLKRKQGIKTPVSTSKLNALIDYPLPTYVAGVDINEEKVYIVAAFDRTSTYTNSIPTKHCLETNSCKNISLLNELKEDVIKFWKNLNIDTYKPSYKTLL